MTTTAMSNFQLQVLAGIAAGEVTRVQVGKLVHMCWHRPAGFVSRFGTVYTRRPTHTVNVLASSGFARVKPDGTVSLTPAGKRCLTREAR